MRHLYHCFQRFIKLSHGISHELALFRLALTTFLTLSLTYPLVLGYADRMQTNLDGSFLGQASMNDAIIDCELASAIIFLPPALDSLLDCFFNGIDAVALEKVVILFGYLVTFTCQYVSSYFDKCAVVYIVCFLIQIFIAVCTALSALSRACPHFNAKASLLVAILLYVSFFCILYSHISPSNEADIICSVFFFASMLLFIVLLLNHLVREVFAIFRLTLSFTQYFKSIGENERYGFIAAVISLVIITTYAVLMAIYTKNVKGSQSTGEQYLLIINIMSIIFALLAILLPQRFIKLHSDELTNVLDAKKTFVRYFHSPILTGDLQLFHDD